MSELNETTSEIALISLIFVAALLVIGFCGFSILKLFIKRCRREGSRRRPPILVTTASTADVPSCVNDAFDCVDETSARKIEERRRARQQELMQCSPRADQTLRKIDAEIGKALAVEQLMRGSLVFDTLPRQPPKTKIQVVAAKRDYL